ncbi:MAG TPA: NAD(P)/FAD-dependent oxidoreductase [Thermomicrobiales bacterium]|nr:NAD(P)/FAD-dependent oxidoreductase [Thermomicrobiales bacterium]
MGIALRRNLTRLTAGLFVFLAIRRLVGVAFGRRGPEHVSASGLPDDANAHRVVILGGGFGGVATALTLDRLLRHRDDVLTQVIDRDNALLFTPLLWTVAEGRADASDVVVPIRSFQRRRRFHLLHAEVRQIDLDRRVVITSAGPQRYDTLVIALGSVTATPDLPGLRQRARVFHNPADAVALRNQLIDAVEAAHHEADPAARRAWLTFVVGGGGDTGVELAATIETYLASGLLAAYPWLADEAPRVVIVGRADRLVPMGDRQTSERVRQALEAAGVEVWTGASIDAVADDRVETSRGPIPARTLFWAAGITAPRVVAELPAAHARNGALLVNDRLQIPDRPEVFVIGDAAWAFDAATGDPIPPTAQAAGLEGDYVARAIAARLDGLTIGPYRYAPRGHLALLGNRSGVARIGPLIFSGLPAWFVWHAYYLRQIPSWRNRLHLLLDWTLAATTGRDTAQLRLAGAPQRRENAA